MNRLLHWVRGQGRRVAGPVVAPLMGCVLAFNLMEAGHAAVQTVPVDLGVANAAAPAFSPDGRTVYVGKRKGTDGAAIVRLMRQGDGWGAAVPANFSDGSHRDLEPVFAPSGRYLIFASNRTAIPGQADFDGHFNGALQSGKGGALWRVDIVDGVPGAPVRLTDFINSIDSVFSPALTADGSLYFMRADGGQKFHIFRSQFSGGHFAAPAPAAFTDERYGDYDPAVSPDEAFIIFSSGRPPTPPKASDLFIAFRNGTAWSAPIDLRTALSPDVFGFEARLSPDARSLYFVNSRSPSGQSDETSRFLWKVDLTSVVSRGSAPR